MTPGRRSPAVAGSFYPADPSALRARVDACLAASGATSSSAGAVAAIVPHAGLEYSGACAGAVFARLNLPETIVILAPNHTGICRSPGASVWQSGAFETPLGDVTIDAELAAHLVRTSDLVAHDPDAHRGEHAIEVELPFVRVRSAAATVVPVVIAWDDWPRCRQLAAALAAVVAARGGPARVLVLASSDMTHYEPAPAAARKDRLALDAIARLDGRALIDACDRERITMCGRAPAAVAVETARRLGAATAVVVDYRHSGLVTGDHSSVVAYAGVIVAAPETPA